MSFIGKNLDNPFDPANRSLEPYILLVEKGVNAVEEEPYYVLVKVSYNDSGFSKRMKKIIESPNVGIQFEFTEKSVGSFFKPRYEPDLWLKIIKDRTELIEASNYARLLTLGIANPDIENNSMTLEMIIEQKIKFSERVKAELFATRLQNELASFFEREYENYQILLKEEF